MPDGLADTTLTHPAGLRQLRRLPLQGGSMLGVSLCHLFLQLLNAPLQTLHLPLFIMEVGQVLVARLAGGGQQGLGAVEGCVGGGDGCVGVARDDLDSLLVSLLVLLLCKHPGSQVVTAKHCG